MQVTPLRWDGNSLFLLDQRLLPREEKWLEYRDASGVAEAIRTMVVRGAPAIGATFAAGAGGVPRPPRSGPMSNATSALPTNSCPRGMNHSALATAPIVPATVTALGVRPRASSHAPIGSVTRETDARAKMFSMACRSLAGLLKRAARG